MKITEISDSLSGAANLARDAKRRADCAWTTCDMARYQLIDVAAAVQKLRNGIRLAIAMAEDSSDERHLVANDIAHWEQILKDTEGLV